MLQILDAFDCKLPNGKTKRLGEHVKLTVENVNDSGAIEVAVKTSYYSYGIEWRHSKGVISPENQWKLSFGLILLGCSHGGAKCREELATGLE